MPRAMWSGAISFGLVNIPIKLFTAVSRKNVSFNQIDTRTGSRIQYRKVSAADGDEVPNEAIAKGYQLSSGEYVLVGDDELAALDPEATRTIDIEQFVEPWRSRARWRSPASSCAPSSTWRRCVPRTGCW